MNTLLETLKPICTAKIFNDLVHLPASLELVEINYTRIGVHEVKRRRAIFSRDIKPEFFKYLAIHHAKDLNAMGLNAFAIGRMREGLTPENTSGQQLNASVDHVLSLNFGGTNDFENLALLPTHLNALKDTLENLQLQKGVTQGTLITIIPKKGAKIPFIKGGFTRARLHA